MKDPTAAINDRVGDTLLPPALIVTPMVFESLFSAAPGKQGERESSREVLKPYRFKGSAVRLWLQNRVKMMI